MVTVSNHSYDSFHLSVKINMTTGSGSVSVGEDAWVRVSDCASIKMEMGFMMIQMNTTFDPPQQGLNFPLGDGKTRSE
jgi:hypothetical protein